MALPKLPNEIIFKIIKEADGGLTTHKKKMISIIKEINQDNHPNHQIRRMKETYSSYVEENRWEELRQYIKAMRTCRMSFKQFCPEEYLPEGYNQRDPRQY